MTRKKVKAYDKLSKKRLLELFEQGKTPADPEVKELGYKGTTVYTFYSRWKSGKEVTKATKLETKGETLGAFEDIRVKTPEPTEEEGEAKPEEGKGEREIPELPKLVEGKGIAVTKLELSVKTLAYYQMAATVAGNNLSLGDFLDFVTEDFFSGRGQSLGLVKLNPKKEGGK